MRLCAIGQWPTELFCDKRPVTLVGINFRTAKRNIDEPVMGRLKG